MTFDTQKGDVFPIIDLIQAIRLNYAAGYR